MIRPPLWFALLLALFAAACAKHPPPVQTMAEARAALQAAHDLHPAPGSSAADRVTRAERALRKAADALEGHRYMEARSAAKKARDLARSAIRMMRSPRSSSH